MLRQVLISVVALAAVGWGLTARAQCPFEWTPGFHAPGLTADAGGEVFSLAVFDDGSGPALYVSGDFDGVGHLRGVRFPLARWDGTEWSAVGEWDPTWYRPAGFCVYDDGSGPALYASASGLRKWDGVAWSSLSELATYSLVVFDDGTGPTLYGSQYHGLGECQIVRWNGADWEDVGPLLSSWDYWMYVSALTVYDDGSGAKLYAGGFISEAGELPVGNIACWDGTQWSDVGGGVNDDVLDLEVYDPPGPEGPGLYAVGEFNWAGTQAANRVARWDGTSWSALGVGIDDPAWLRDATCLCVYDDGGGPALCVGGDFDQAGGQTAAGLAKWDGTSWSPLATSSSHVQMHMLPRVSSLAVFDPPGAEQGPGLYVGGDVMAFDGVAVNGIARRDAAGTFSALGDGNGLNAEVFTLCRYDDGTGPAVYAGGWFSNAGDQVVNYIARWDGTSWSPLAGGMDVWVATLAVYDPPGPDVGSELYAGGRFWLAGDASALFVARWDGQRWAALGDGICFIVHALCVHDDGSGAALYVAGEEDDGCAAFDANGIARWDGEHWSPVGGGLGEPGYSSAVVRALCSFDPPGPEGPALYAGGDFEFGAFPGDGCGIAKWDGESWSQVGEGLWRLNGEYAEPGGVRAMVVFDDGSGPALYVEGGFNVAGTQPSEGFARWDGTQWSSVAIEGLEHVWVEPMLVYDAGYGQALYMDARPREGEDGFRGVVKWDGRRCSTVGSEVRGGARAMLGVHEPSGPAIYVGGYFLTTGPWAVSHLGKLSCPEGFLLGDVNCDGAVDQFDIDAFVTALVNPAAYETVYPNCYVEAADCNGDGLVNAFDIGPFVGLLLGG